MILALETTFNACCVSLAKDNQYILSHQIPPRQQTQLILPMIDDLLAKESVSFADIKYIAFNRGPGSFSGIRINTAVAQALAYAHNLSCVPVSALKAQAHCFFETHKNIDDVTIVNDAKMQELYTASYSKTSMHGDNFSLNLLDEEKLLPVDISPLIFCTTQHACGDGINFLKKAKDDGIEYFEEALEVTAEHIAKIAQQNIQEGKVVNAEMAQPVYLRNNAWKTLAEQNKKAPI